MGVTSALRCRLLIGLGVGMTIFFAGEATAGDDEIDYSAPYVTLENGVLVTRYPIREHDPADKSSTAATPAPENPGPSGQATVILSSAVLATVAVILTGTWLRKRRRRQGR